MDIIARHIESRYSGYHHISAKLHRAQSRHTYYKRIKMLINAQNPWKQRVFGFSHLLGNLTCKIKYGILKIDIRRSEQQKISFSRRKQNEKAKPYVADSNIDSRSHFEHGDSNKCDGT
jgi:hypothetical protein